jgi:hypothetical protein
MYAASNRMTSFVLIAFSNRRHRSSILLTMSGCIALIERFEKNVFRAARRSRWRLCDTVANEEVGAPAKTTQSAYLSRFLDAAA